MSNKITVSPDKDGRYIIHLYGKDIEIDESMFVDGIATLKQFGDEYTIVKSNKKAKRAKKEAEVVTEENSEVAEADTNTEADE